MQEPEDRSKSSPEKASCLQTDLQVVRGIKKIKICQVTHSGDIQSSQRTNLSTLCNMAQKSSSISSEADVSAIRRAVPELSAQDGTRGTGQSGAGNVRKTPLPLCPCCQLTTTSFALSKPAPACLSFVAVPPKSLFNLGNT